jgi:hypothetical protein
MLRLPPSILPVNKRGEGSGQAVDVGKLGPFPENLATSPKPRVFRTLRHLPIWQIIAGWGPSLGAPLPFNSRRGRRDGFPAFSPAILGIWARFAGLFLAALRKYGLVLTLFRVTMGTGPPKYLGRPSPVQLRQDAGPSCFATDKAAGIGPQTVWKPLAQIYG